MLTIALILIGIALTIYSLWPDPPERMVAKRHHGIKRANW